MTSINATEFNLDLQKFMDSLEPGLIVPFHKKIHMQLVERITKKMPVDTGQARGGTQTGVGVALEGQTGRTDKRGGATISANLAALSPLIAGQTSYITNNVKHVGFLEQGRPGPGSKQAPQGMFAVSLEEVKAQFP